MSGRLVCCHLTDWTEWSGQPDETLVPVLPETAPGYLITRRSKEPAPARFIQRHGVSLWICGAAGLCVVGTVMKRRNSPRVQFLARTRLVTPATRRPSGRQPRSDLRCAVLGSGSVPRPRRSLAPHTPSANRGAPFRGSWPCGDYRGASRNGVDVGDEGQPATS